MKENGTIPHKRLLNPPLLPFVRRATRGITFITILLSLNMAYSQEMGGSQGSSPPLPSSPVEREGKREGATVPEGTQRGTSAEDGRDSVPMGATEGTQISQPTAVGGPRFGISTRYQTVSSDTGSSKAREYRSLPEGLFIDSLSFYYGSERQEFGGEVTRVYPLTGMIDDGYGNLTYRKYGLLDVGIDLGKYPHDYGTTSSGDVSVQRDTYNLLFKFTPGDKLVITTNLSIEDRKGTRPLTVESLTGNVNDPTAISEIKEPINYTTTAIDLGMEYLDDVVDVQLNNNLQIFSNTLSDEVTWPNPDITGASGKATVTDDYAVHTLSLKPSLKLTDTTRLVNTLSYSQVISSIHLAPLSTAGIGGSFQNNTLDPDVRSLVLSSILSTRPLTDVRLNLKYRYYAYKNDTPIIKDTPPYVILDANDPAFINKYPRVPRYTSYVTKTIGLDGNWALTERLSFDGGIENKDTSRDEREVGDENEERLFLSIHSMIRDNLSGKIGYSYTQRRGGYDAAYYNAIYDPNSLNNVTQHPLLRVFDLSGLNANALTANLDYSPIDALNLGTMLSLTLNEHPGVTIGRRHSQGESASLYAQYTPFTDFLLYSEYHYDRREIVGRYTWTYDSNLSYPQDPQNPGFTEPVKGHIEDTTTTYIVGLDYEMSKWLSIRTSYSRYYSTGTNVNLPEVDSTTDVYELNFSFSPCRPSLTSNCLFLDLKDIRFNAGYYMEIYQRKDYTLDNIPATGTDIFLGLREPDYRLNIFSVALTLSF